MTFARRCLRYSAINSAIFLAYRPSSCAIYLCSKKRISCAAWEANREDRVGGHVFIENIRADDFAMAVTAFQSRTFRRKRFRTRVFSMVISIFFEKRCVNLKVVKICYNENNVNEKYWMIVSILDLINYEIINEYIYIYMMKIRMQFK